MRAGKATKNPYQLIRYRMVLVYGGYSEKYTILWEGDDRLTVSYKFPRCGDKVILANAQALERKENPPYLTFYCSEGNGIWRTCGDPRLYVFSENEYFSHNEEIRRKEYLRLRKYALWIGVPALIIACIIMIF